MATLPIHDVCLSGSKCLRVLVSGRLITGITNKKVFALLYP